MSNEFQQARQWQQVMQNLAPGMGSPDLGPALKLQKRLLNAQAEILQGYLEMVQNHIDRLSSAESGAEAAEPERIVVK
jgi:hypothetical protein